MSNLGFLDKAVHHFCGVLPEHLGKCNFLSLRVGNGGIYAPYYVTHEMEEDTICSREEFQQRARELGYGVEAAEPESWYCYETQKALRLPPVGVECEWKPHSPCKSDWKKCVVDYVHGEWVCVTNSNSYKMKQILNNVKFRPLDHAARKAEAERKRVVDAAYDLDSLSLDRQDLEFLYDAGFLRMPEDK
jgi:hypothetical protein